MTLYTVSVLQKLREGLVLILITLLPFHAFLVTVVTRWIAGPGNAPFWWLALWKEFLLVFILLIVVSELVRRKYQYINILVFPFDVLDWVIVGLLALGIGISIVHSPVFAEATAGKQFSILPFALGAKYTLFPLLLFLIFRRVPWSEYFLLLTSYFLLLTGAVVAAYGIFTLFLPESFFIWLGYSDLHSLYFPEGPLAAFQQIGGTGIRRIQSTFSGPNQLGMWLLVPWSVLVVFLLRELERIRSKEFLLLISYFLLLLLSLSFTFSRAAWMGAAVIVFVLLTTHYKLLTRWKLLGYWVTGLLCVGLIGVIAFPEIFLREVSTSGHWRRPVEAIRVIAAHPFGLGLGSAGPAQNRLSDSCVFLAEGADTSWAKNHPNLCVFSGAVQVQPTGRVCRCPFLPENWYLQVGVELGVIGLVLYLLLVGVTSYWLLVTRPLSPWFLVFVGISTAALFLHTWEDSAVSYTMWILLASIIPVGRKRCFC
ncbi:hypothetical protein A3H90_00895 [Candidatus Peribacteria bacterium RIFCSPLOWO2_02_FULL_55_36]|nr:MAG: hypothetical protein A3H90_00895 [Candidatus Peribacteria bacterium RIFCSPLOWO2_02_FULL_55_36]